LPQKTSSLTANQRNQKHSCTPGAIAVSVPLIFAAAIGIGVANLTAQTIAYTVDRWNTQRATAIIGAWDALARRDRDAGASKEK